MNEGLDERLGTHDALLGLLVRIRYQLNWRFHMGAEPAAETRAVGSQSGDTTMNRLKIITVLVLDQDAAIEFYTPKLGFELREEKPFGETRWVTISLPEDGDLTIALQLAKTTKDMAIVGNQAGSHALLALDTSDCIGD